MSLDITLSRVQRVCIYDTNITHNLGKMAEAAGLYTALWRPEDIGATKAKYLINLLQIGLIDLKENRTYYEQFNSSNGWGIYDNFVRFVERYLEACIMYPDADIEVSR